MKIGIVGATGLVGQKLLTLLENSLLPIDELRLIASQRSLGKKLPYRGKEVDVIPLSDRGFASLNLVFFMATKDVAKKYAPLAIKNNCVVIDNSSYFRLNPEVPLIVPEVNIASIKNEHALIANPNCSTIQLVVCLNALAKINPIKRVEVAPYQAVSGAGRKAIEELKSKIRDYNNKIVFNAVPHIDDFDKSGYTKEELKVIFETQKILNQEFPISCTAVRIPVINGHSESISITFENEVNILSVHQIFKNSENIIVIDDIENNKYPLVEDCQGRQEVFVGRIRKDFSNPNILHLWCVADNLVKGAAANALQIAEKCFKQKIFGW